MAVKRYFEIGSSNAVNFSLNDAFFQLLYKPYAAFTSSEVI